MVNDYGVSNGFAVQLAGPFGSVGSSGKITQISLPAANWKNGESPFFQAVEIDPGYQRANCEAVRGWYCYLHRE